MNTLALSDAISYLEHEETVTIERGYHLGRGVRAALFEDSSSEPEEI